MSEIIDLLGDVRTGFLLSPIIALVVVAVVRRSGVFADVRWWFAFTTLLWTLGLMLHPISGGLHSPSWRAMRTCVAGWLASPRPVGLSDPVVQLNVVVFALLAFSWVLATRQVIGVLLGTAALAAVVELVQPVVGRTCSGQEWSADVVGAAVGGLLMAAVLGVHHLWRRRVRRARPRA